MSRDERTVTIIVPVRNEERHIDASLTSVRNQTYPGITQILVVDGESSDGTRTVAERHIAEDNRFALLRNPGRSMSHGLNIGIQAATGMYVGVAIGHAVLPADYVARAIAALERTGAWAVGGRMVRRATGPLHAAIAIATSSRIGVGDSVHNYSRRSGWADSAFPGFWRRDVFDTIGLFDTDMLVNEDNELSYRITRAGGRIWFEATLEIEYVPRSSLAGLFHQYRRYAIGRMHVLRKHRAGLRWRHFVPGLWLSALVGGGLFAIVIPGVGVVWAAMLVAYLAVILLASLRLSRRGAPWSLLAAALVTLHAAYGIGTWQGALSWLRSVARSTTPSA